MRSEGKENLVSSFVWIAFIGCLVTKCAPRIVFILTTDTTVSRN